VVADAMVTPKTVGGIANVFKSIQRLEAEETLCASKKMLTELKPVYGLAYLATESELGDLEPCHSRGYFTCGASAHCTFVSPRYRALHLLTLDQRGEGFGLTKVTFSVNVRKF